MLGSRFLGDPLAGGMPTWKYVANRFLTGVENLAFGLPCPSTTPACAPTAGTCSRRSRTANSDDFVFDQELIAQVVAAGMRDRIGEIAVPTRYFEEASSVGFRRSVVYGLSTLRVVVRYLLHRSRLRRSAKLRRASRTVRPDPPPAGRDVPTWRSVGARCPGHARHRDQLIAAIWILLRWSTSARPDVLRRRARPGSR